MNSFNPVLLNDSVYNTTSASYSEIVSAADNTAGVLVTLMNAVAGGTIGVGAAASETDLIQIQNTTTGTTSVSVDKEFVISAGQRVAGKASSGLFTVCYKVL